MHLTPNEERTLAGEEGSGRQKAMELVVAIGDIYGAERLIPISSAQVSGASFKTIGDAGIRFLEDFSKEAKATVRASVNPLGLDLRRWRSMGIEDGFKEKQSRIVSAYSAMGLEPLYTCTPYLSGNRPRPGQHLAWAESSATVFANSVLRAMTNREGGPSALASAIIGKTAEYGLHLKENRAPRVRIDLEAVPPGLVPLAGYVVGKIAGNRIPYLPGLSLSQDEHKAFGAAMAATSAVSMYVYSDRGDRRRPDMSRVEERVSLPASELAGCRDSLKGDDSWDLVAIGCPHSSPSELRSMARFLKDRKPAGDADVWFCTCRKAYAACPDAVRVLKRFGKVLCDTCMVVSPIERMYKRTASDSGKAMVYLPTLGKQRPTFRTTGQLLEAISR
ncbi:MAG: mevalonate 5-phosphate dehydratase large subunit [Candidatus Thermoplasmatota archaeon]|nr:mevalonate 5-phosphate dehydratase large subunit [Candidatus Thermoplasmatota archaeon]